MDIKVETIRQTNENSLMRMRVMSQVCVTVWSILLSVAEAQESTIVAYVGDTAVRIPAPEGFFRYDGKNPQIDAFAKRLVGNKRLLVAYSSKDDLTAVLNGQFPRLARYFTAEVDPKLEVVAVTPELFDGLRSRLRETFNGGREKYPDVIKEAEADASSAVAGASKQFSGLKIGDVVPLGVFDETNNSLCFSLVTKAQLSAVNGTQQPEYLVVSAVSAVRVRDRLLGISCAAMYNGKSDIEWAQHSVQSWRDAILAANAE